MRQRRVSGRGERARVARRVRALLDDVREQPGDDAGSVRPDSPVPWLPTDDLAAHLPSAVPFGAPQPSDPPSDDGASRISGWFARRRQRLPVRIDPGWRGAAAVGAAVLLAALITGGWLLAARPHAIAVTDTGADPTAVQSARASAASAGSLSPDPQPAPATPATRPPTVVVDVAGKVRHPGLYRLPTGSRVDDAVQAAGGPLPGVDLGTVNLAAMITDGEQIAVGMPAAPGSAGSGGTGPTGTGVLVPVDLNSATLEQLETLPGVGPVLGQHIIDWRQQHGQFATVDQLRDVSGIGDAKFADLRGLVMV